MNEPSSTATMPYTEVTEFLVLNDEGLWEFSMYWRTPHGIVQSELCILKQEDMIGPNQMPHRVILAMYREKLWQAFEKQHNPQPIVSKG